MRTKLREGWYAPVYDDELDLKQSGIYEWRIEGVGLYVGKAKTLRSRIRHYPNNVRRMIDGKPWRGNSNRDFRDVHYHLRQAYDDGTGVTVAVLELCEPAIRAERERYWIERRREEHKAGGPQVLNATRRIEIDRLRDTPLRRIKN